jgi:hypothetical protein
VLKVVVKITQADLDKGFARSYTMDSVANAIKRAVKNAFNYHRDFQVLIPNLDFGFIDGRYFELPKVAQDIIHFSEHPEKKQRPQPGEFVLEMPEDFFDENAAMAS